MAIITFALPAAIEVSQMVVNRAKELKCQKFYLEYRGEGKECDKLGLYRLTRIV